MDEKKILELRKIQERSLTSFIADEIERMIFSGEMEPGSRINESQLSREMGVSRAPIREACRKLERYGYVRVSPNRGTYIEKVSLNDVAELCDLRALLDGFAGEKAAPRFKDHHRDELESLIDEMVKCTHRKDLKGYSDANLKFHLAIIFISGNQHLYKVYKGFYKKMMLWKNLFVISDARLQRSFEQHKKILAALSEKDAIRASHLMREHVLDSKEGYLLELQESDTSEKFVTDACSR